MGNSEFQSGGWGLGKGGRGRGVDDLSEPVERCLVSTDKVLD